MKSIYYFPTRHRVQHTSSYILSRYYNSPPISFFKILPILVNFQVFPGLLVAAIDVRSGEQLDIIFQIRWYFSADSTDSGIIKDSVLKNQK